jgi:hypothetical protein
MSHVCWIDDMQTLRKWSDGNTYTQGGISSAFSPDHKPKIMMAS